MEREFAIGDVLSVTTGKLVSPRHMEGVYDVLSFMLDRPVYTHEIPTVIPVCAQALIEERPDLAEEDPQVTTKEELQHYIAEVTERLGSVISIRPLPEDIRSRYSGMSPSSSVGP